MVSCIFALLEKRSLAFYVCPETWPITLSHTLLSLHESLSPFCRSCFSMPGSLLTPGFHPLFRMSSLFLGFPQQRPVSVLLLPSMLSTCFLFPPCTPPPKTHTTTDCLVYSRGWVMGSKLIFCVSELMNTPTGRSGE